MSGALYSADDLQVMFVVRESGWGVCLTGQGIGNAFSGSNGLVILAACYGSQAFSCGIGGARQIIGWVGDVQSSIAQSEVNTLLSRLTGGDPAFMSTQTAINGTMSYAGGWMALVPYIVSVIKPNYNLVDTLNTVTWNFGAKMKTDGQPYVGGVAVRRGYSWPNDTTLVCNFYCGWEKGEVVAGLASTEGISSKGICLLNDDPHEFWCTIKSYPPAASVISFVPLLRPTGVEISTELGLWKRSRAFWVTRENGSVVGDTVLVKDLAGPRFRVFDSERDETQNYYLYEQEIAGTVFIRAEEGVLSEPPSVVSYPLADFDRAKLESDLQKWSRLDPDATQTTPVVGLIIVPDAWATNAQTLANWHASHGRGVSVATLSVTGSTREDIKAYVDAAYLGGARYVLLGAGAHDEWFDEEQKWPDMSGVDDWRYWFHYYHDVMGYVSTPSRNIIPTWYYPDTEYDNRSYWTPYYVSDIGYTENLPGLRLGRFPAYSLEEFQVLVNKTIHYMENTNNWDFSDEISLWAYCHDSDGNVGHTVEVLADEISQMIPPSFVQYRQNDYTLNYAEREAWAVSDWSAGRGYIVMSGTASTPHKPINFFKKDLGWQINKLIANQYFSLLLGMSCGIGGFDMCLHPTIGTAVAQDLMTADPNRGTCLIIAPSRGTYMESSQQLSRALVKHFMQDPASDIGTAFLAAQQDVAVLDSSYCLYGDPMAVLPGQSPATGITSHVMAKTYLGQNYPNPFNPITVIDYSVAENTFVSLRVFNVAGQLVATLVSEQKMPGPHRATWDSSGKASGIYFYRLRAGSFSQTRKMALLK